MDAVELARQKIDEKIQILLRPIRALKTERNALAPIHKLPLEILSEIFVYAHECWKTLTSVCTHWRSVSLQCPLLWNELLNPYHRVPEWTALVLERSKNAPIDIVLREWNKRRPSVVIALRHAHRVRNLSIHGSPVFLTGVVDKISGPAPSLESLELYNEDKNSPPYIPPDSFCSSTPRLQSLRLVRCAIPWERLSCRNLVYLSIMRPSSKGDQDMRLTVAQLLRILGEAPALKDLELWDALRDNPGGLEHVADSLRISLPRLERVTDLESNVSTSTFLRHIQFPSHTTFSAEWNVDFVNVNAVVGAALSLFNGTRVRFAHKLDFRRAASSMFIECEGHEDPLGYSMREKCLTLNLSFRSAWAYASLLSTFFQRLTFANLTHLCIWGEGVTAADWAGYLATFGGLETVLGGGPAGNSLVRALIATDERDTVVVPRLRELVLAELSLDEDLKDMLEECLDSRRKRDVGLYRVVFMACADLAFPPEDDLVEYFEAWKVRVEWRTMVTSVY